MPRLPLSTRLYQEPALYEAARLIGYEGIEFSAFWDEAKALSLDEKVGKHKLLNAVYDLTRADRREAAPPRYELTAPARQACWQLLGPPPEHPLYGDFEEQRKQWRQEIEAERQSEPAAKKLKKGRRR